MKIKKIFLLLSVSTALLACSVVFTGSITGSLVDAKLYDSGSNAAGIADAEIYLYTDIKERDADYDAWMADETTLPDNPVDGEPVYFLKTITDNQGNYTFNGFIWNELFPDYGKSGDRKEIYMLFYHRDYGLTKTAYPVYIVSDVTNRIPLFKLSRIINTAEIAGTVFDAENNEPMINANVYLWVPESWKYSAGGAVDTDESSFSWNDDPSYTVLTDNTGEWEQEISYKMMPSSSSNNGTTIVRVTFAANGYIAENAADSDITDGGWDRDGNGSVDSDEDDGYFQSSEIAAGSYAELGDIGLANKYNIASVSGKLLNTNTNEGEPNVSVRIWGAEDWSYLSADPEDIAEPDSADCVWPENPDYTLVTNAEGEFSQDIQFERKPSEADNRKTTRVRLVFIKDTFRIDSLTDLKLTENPSPGGSWDRDGNGTVDPDEDDAFMDPDKVIKADQDNALGSINIKQTEFSETLSGEVVDNVSGLGLNGVVVWLFFTPDHDGDPETAHQDTVKPTVGVTKPTRKTTTTRLEIITQDQLIIGYFSFSGLEWTDDSYTELQSDIGYYIYLPDEDEIESGVYSGNGTPVDADLKMKQLLAGAENNVSLRR